MAENQEEKKLAPKIPGRDYKSNQNKSVTVEVKRRKARPFMGFNLNKPFAEEDLETKEKLELVKKAKEQSRIRSQQAQEAQETIEAEVKSEEQKGSTLVETPILPIPEAHKEITHHGVDKISKKDLSIVDEDDEELNKKDKFAKKLGLKQPLAKGKYELGGRRSSKIVIQKLDFEEDNEKGRSLASIKRAREKARREQEDAQVEKISREVVLPEFITISELSSRMAERGIDVIKEFMKLGMIVNLHQIIDADTAELVIHEMGHRVKRVTEADVENILEDTNEDKPEDLLPRPPVVTIMGHVDHGKTTLLDALRSTDVASGEAGGITQHIGAYQVQVKTSELITFLDTPGHEAFTQMRSRGAKVTDIVVLVVAADDGIKPQTVEAINHAKAAGVPIIVAINKIDKPDADPNKVLNELLNYELVAESMGGEVITVPVSAKAKTNLDKLVEAILLQAEVLELKANPNKPARGVVIESKVDKGRGVVTTLLVQKGTLRKGDIIIAGPASGRVKMMANDKNQTLDEALPSTPVEIIGLEESPMAGDQFNVITSEKQARDIGEYRLRKIKNEKNAKVVKTSLEDLFAKAAGEDTQKALTLIIKGDVQGSIEAIASSLEKLTNEEVLVKILHKAVGGINESDIALANASKAIIIGFNVRASTKAKEVAEKEKIDIRYYSIIYDLIDDMKLLMSGMLKPIIRENYIGNVEIREVFNITKVGKIAGSFVTDGIIKRGAKVRLLRDDVVIHEGTLKTLKRFKDDVKEVKAGYECGIAFENYDDIKQGDKVEVFELVEERKVL